ncbi:MAG: SDR family oxidoreductase [Candidatus Acidiferrum sp.]|jgi:NAD(P)-dependent dehydrogenase (short-subunit alcohol dehydrogenase family)
MSEDRGTLIVTGGGRGIGAAISRMAGARGYAVAVNYRSDQASADRVVEDIRRNHGRAMAIQGDVGTEGDVLGLFAAAEQTLGPLSALVNNAGITGGFARIESVEAAALERLMAVNVTGAILCAREAVKRLSGKHGGRGGAIVNISSRAAELGAPGEWVHYAASKAAIDALTIGLGREVATEGIRVNAVAPGLVETDIHAANGDPGRLARLAPTIPMARAGTAEEIAEAVLWLLSPAASFVTATILNVGGGR